MRPARLDTTCLFFVHVLDQFTPHDCDGARDVGARHQDRKVTHVSRIFLLEVNVQTIRSDQPVRKRRPGPMPLSLHDPEQRLPEVVAIHVKRDASISAALRNHRPTEALQAHRPAGARTVARVDLRTTGATTPGMLLSHLYDEAACEWRRWAVCLSQRAERASRSILTESMHG